MSRGFLDSPWPYFVAAAALVALAVASQFEIRTPSRKTAPVERLLDLRERGDLNVVFLLIDTLRADRLGTYGYERPTSATIDELAHYGVVFENVVAQSSWTKTSMASLWTATHPINNGILRYNHVLPDEAVLPAEIFQKAAGWSPTSASPRGSTSTSAPLRARRARAFGAGRTLPWPPSPAPTRS
jgi:hypothetical protein